MRSLLGSLLGRTLLPLGIWGAVMLNWLWRGHVPSATDLFLGFVAVPALLTGGYYLLRRMLESVWNASRSAADASAGEDRPVSPAMAGNAPSDPNQGMNVAVLGGSICVPAGAATELVQACVDGERPTLDATLRDGGGFPIMAARVAALDEMDALQWWEGLGLDAMLPQGEDWIASLTVAQGRELRMLEQVLTEAAIELERFHAASGAGPDGPGEAAGHALDADMTALVPRGEGATESGRPPVRLALLMDGAWTDADLAMLHTCVQVGLERCAPSLRFESAAPAAWAADGAAPTEGVAGWLKRLIDPAAGPEATQEAVWLVAGARSLVDQALIDSLAASGRLYQASRRNGVVAGEGAAALLLARAPATARPGGVDVSQSPILLDMAAVEATGDKRGAALGKLALGLLESHGVPIDEVSRVISDADHRPGPASEVAMLVSQHLPDLEFERDCLMLGQPCGHTGGVAAIAALVLAAEHASAAQAGALTLTVAVDGQRGAALVMPAGWRSGGAEAAAPAEGQAEA